MAAKRETPLQRLKSTPLWQWGMICIVSGIASNLLNFTSGSANSAEQRGAMVGRGVASLLFILAGVVLIVVHFVRAKRK